MEEEVSAYDGSRDLYVHEIFCRLRCDGGEQYACRLDSAIFFFSEIVHVNRFAMTKLQ